MSVIDEDVKTPVLYDHCCTVYKAMLDAASPRHADDDPKDVMMVYEGHLTRLFTELRLSVPYYTTVMGALQRMGCVRQLRRGGGNAMSQWELVREPSEEGFHLTAARQGGKPSKYDGLQQQIRDLNSRLLRAEAALGLANVED